MGSGVWREDTFRMYSRKMGRVIDKHGRISGDLKNQEMFAMRTMSPLLNPNNVIRECRDTKEHPATIPVILALDVTGSMGQAAVEVAKQLNVIMTSLYEKVKDVEFMVMGIGDFAYDRCPLQVSQFESDIRIAEQLDKLYFEFGGGGNSYESYTAAWYFAVNQIELDAWKRGSKGLIITMGDEAINPYIPGKALAEATGQQIDGDVETEALLQEVQEKYEIYHIYVDHRGRDRAERDVKEWEEYLDKQRVKIVGIDNISAEIIKIVEAHAGNDSLKSDYVVFPKAAGIAW